jgi:hypothetical protein
MKFKRSLQKSYILDLIILWLFAAPISEKFDFTAEDRVNDAEFNEVIWKAVKGIDSPCPPTVHAAFFFADKNE